MILDIVFGVYLFLVFNGSVWFYRKIREQDRRLKKASDAVAEMNRNLRWSVIQVAALSIALWQTGGRGVMQVKVPLPPDGSSHKIVIVSVTSQAIVISSPGEEEFVIKMTE